MLVHAWMFIFAAFLFAGQQTNAEREAWNRPVEPFRIIGNVYYVGAAGVSAFLIHSPDGSVLLDGGLPETAPQIARNVAALGFDIKSVKYLLNSHAHYDHAGGLAELKRLSRAKMVASGGDEPALRTGKALFGDFPAVAVDEFAGEGSTIKVGSTELTARLTPGHTKGCTTWTMTAREGGRDYRVLFHCSTSVVDRLFGSTDNPNIVSDYQRTFAKLAGMKADVLLAAHPFAFRMDEKRSAMKPGAPNPFIDPGELARFNASSRQAFEAALAKERAALPAVDDAEEYAIYRILAERSWPVRTGGVSRLIVQEETSYWNPGSCTASIPERNREWRGVFESWQAANESAARLQPDRDLGRPYQLRSTADLSAYFSSAGPGGWQKFYEEHPDARAFYVVSRVGFSPDRRRAMVYFSDHCGGLCGHGQIFTLEKVRDQWRLVNVPGAKLCMWVS